MMQPACEIYPDLTYPASDTQPALDTYPDVTYPALTYPSSTYLTCEPHKEGGNARGDPTAREHSIQATLWETAKTTLSFLAFPCIFALAWASLDAMALHIGLWP